MGLVGKQLQYADLVARGRSPVDAYLEAYGPGCTKAAAYKGSERLSKNVEVQGEIARVREVVRGELGAECADVKEVMKFLSDVLRLAPGLVALDSPLVQRLKVTRPFSAKGKPLAVNGEGLTQQELFEDAEVVIPDKLKAADMLLRCFGTYKADENAGKAGDALANLMASIASKGG